MFRLIKRIITRVVTVALLLGVVVGLSLGLIYLSTGNIYLSDVQEKIGKDAVDLTPSRPEKITEFDRRMDRMRQDDLVGLSDTLSIHEDSGYYDVVSDTNDLFGDNLVLLEELKEDIDAGTSLSDMNASRLNRETKKIIALTKEIEIEYDTMIKEKEDSEEEDITVNPELHKDITESIDSYITSLEELSRAFDTEDYENVVKYAEGAYQIGRYLGL